MEVKTIMILFIFAVITGLVFKWAIDKCNEEARQRGFSKSGNKGKRRKGI